MFGAPARTRTWDNVVNSHALYLLSYGGERTNILFGIMFKKILNPHLILLQFHQNLYKIFRQQYYLMVDRQFHESREGGRDNAIIEAVETLEEAGKRAPKLFGIPTGIAGLDEMFFTTKIEGDKVKKVPLGGLPSLAVVNLTGVSDTGKSLMAEQFAITQASLGYAVCFVTVEAPSAFVAMGLKERARAMGIKWEEIENRIVLIDAATHSSLRDDVQTLMNTIEYAIQNYDTKSVVIDSVTGLYEAREMMARTIVRKLFNFMKRHYQTAIFVSQKRSGHEELTAEAAGGYAVSHIVDCSIVVSKELIMSRYAANLYKRPLGSIIRLIRIDGCRMCGHDTRTHVFEITETGLVKVGPALEELLKEDGNQKSFSGGAE